MNIYREVLNRIEIPALPSLENGYYLLRFERNGTTSNVYAVVENESGMGVPITASLTEIGTGTPNPVNGEVLLAPGNWTLFFYEQVSGTNTNPDCSTIPLGQTEVTVYGDSAAVISQTPADCPSSGGGTPGGNNGDIQVKSGTAFAGLANAASNINSKKIVALTSGSITQQYRDSGQTDSGQPVYTPLGVTPDEDYVYYNTDHYEVVVAETTIYTGNTGETDIEAVQWTAVNGGVAPLPSVVFVDATDVQAAVEEVAGEVAAKDMVYLNDVLQAQTVTRVYTGLTDSGGEVTGSITGIATIVGAWGQPGMDAGDAGVRVFASLYSIDTSSYIFRCALADGNNPTIDTPVKVFIIGIPS